MLSSSLILALQFLSAGNEKTPALNQPKTMQELATVLPENTISGENNLQNLNAKNLQSKTTNYYNEQKPQNVVSIANTKTQIQNVVNVVSAPKPNQVRESVGNNANQTVQNTSNVTANVNAINTPANSAKKANNPQPKTITYKDYHKNDGPFRGGWIGLHYTSQYPQTPILKDSWRQNAGFNLQFMSHNLTGRRDFAGYLGFDFGMQFTGRGKNSTVVLDNTSLDSGFTRLSNFSMDFFARAHFEYAKFRLKPYINLFAGPRIFATNQYTEAYHQKTDYDNSSSTSAFSSASLMYGLGVGLRYRIGKSVSLDLRYEAMQGTQATMINLDKSTFNGLNYNLSKFTVNPVYTQFKIGFLFDVGDEEEYVHKDQSETQTEYYTYDSATQLYTKVKCACKQWTVSDTTSEDSGIIVKNRNEIYIPSDPTLKPLGSGSGFFPTGSGRSGSSGRSRGGFPGIKSGSGGIRPKN